MAPPMDEHAITDVAPVTPGGDTPAAERPLNYMSAAIAIARLDVEVMGRVSRDRMAIVYGAAMFVVVTALSLLLRFVIAGVAPNIAAIAFGAVFGLVVSVVTTGIIHVLAKVMFQATGTLAGLLRVLWLGSIVSLAGVIPIIGGIVSAIWSVLLTMVTFQEVDGIERLQALALSIGVGLGFYLLLGALTQYMQ